MTMQTDTAVAGFELPAGTNATAPTALDLLSDARIASFATLGLKGCIHIEELCNQNFGLIVSSDTLRTLSQDLLRLADQADRPDCNQTDIRELMDAVVRSGNDSLTETDAPLTSYKEHAHNVQMALLYVAKSYGQSMEWVKQQLSELTLDATLALIVNVNVPDHYRDTLNQQLTNIPGYQPVESFLGSACRPVPSQDQEVYRHYDYFVYLIQQAAKAL